MLNKITQGIDIPKGRLTLGRHPKTKNKLTQLIVHRMLKHNMDAEVDSHSSSYIITNIAPRTSTHENNALRQKIIRRDKIKTELSQPRQLVMREGRTVGRWYCEPKDESESVQGTRDRKILNYRVILPQKSQQMHRAINDRVRKMVKSGKQQLIQSQQSFSLINFGLSISQIKRVSTPKKVIKEIKGRDKRSMKMKSKLSNITKTTQDQSQFLDGRQVLAEDAILSLSQECSTPFIKRKNFNNKELMIKKLDQAMRYKRSKSRRFQEVNSFQQKILRMFQCLDIILNSYHCRLNWQKYMADVGGGDLRSAVRKQKQRYLYFIGGGNNSNLIRSLMRKRSWWTEVDSLAKANLVWTQLRVPSVLQRLQRFRESWTTQVVPYQQMNEEECVQSSLLRTTSKTCNSIGQCEPSRIRQGALDMLFHEQQSKKYHQVLEAKQLQTRLELIEPPTLIHNHYEHNYMFGNKNALYYNISKYCQFSNQSVSEAVPLTFYLEKGCKGSLLQFQRVYNQMKGKNCAWILKPAQNSNRGMGIEVSRSLNFIKAKLNTQKKLIVQYYVKNLLLYNNRKFDIRTYMIGVTIKGRLKFYWYDQGYLRTSSEVYDPQNLKDQYIHLTNDAIQKNGDNYGRYEEGNKLSYSQLQRYLDNRCAQENWQVSALHQQMKQIATQVVKATYCRIDSDRRDFGFELYGLDFMVDSYFKPLLIEVNTNPCLELCCSVLERLIPRMMENMFRLCVDPVFRPNADNTCSKSQSYYLYDQTFLERNKFVLMFDQKYDRHFQWQERCQKMRGLEWYNQVEEEFEDEGSLIVLDY